MTNSSKTHGTPLTPHSFPISNPSNIIWYSNIAFSCSPSANAKSISPTSTLTSPPTSEHVLWLFTTPLGRPTGTPARTASAAHVYVQKHSWQQNLARSELSRGARGAEEAAGAAAAGVGRVQFGQVMVGGGAKGKEREEGRRRAFEAVRS